MTMRPFTDARGGLNHLVDAQIGRAFPVVHKVYQHLDAIEYVAKVYEDGRARDIVLRTNHTKEWIEWQYKGEAKWTILFKFSDLLGADIADVVAAEAALAAELEQLRLRLNADMQTAVEAKNASVAAQAGAEAAKTTAQAAVADVDQKILVAAEHEAATSAAANQGAQHLADIEAQVVAAETLAQATEAAASSAQDASIAASSSAQAAEVSAQTAVDSAVAADGSAGAAGVSAGDAATSAQAAAGSADAAADSAAEALNHKTGAGIARDAADASATAAAQAEAGALGAADNATLSASGADTSAQAAQDSADAAAASAVEAGTFAAAADASAQIVSAAQGLVAADAAAVLAAKADAESARDAAQVAQAAAETMVVDAAQVAVDRAAAEATIATVTGAADAAAASALAASQSKQAAATSASEAADSAVTVAAQMGVIDAKLDAADALVVSMEQLRDQTLAYKNAAQDSTTNAQIVLDARVVVEGLANTIATQHTEISGFSATATAAATTATTARDEAVSANTTVSANVLLVDAAKTSAEAAALAAEGSKDAAALSESNAKASEDLASASATSATASATAASGSATAADTSASQASSSASSAATSADTATTKAGEASSSASAASTSADTAATKADEAAASALAAAGSASTASTKASEASTSATNASNSASTATAKAGEAATSAASALASSNNADTKYKLFDERYLGSKTDDPATDNYGQPLLVGAEYWNSVAGVRKVWSGTEWLAENTADIVANLATLTADLDTKAPINNPMFTGTVSGVTKAMVGLADVDNTSDLSKPISTATQAALNAKQSTLVSGTDIKTINGESILGSGDLVVGGGGSGGPTLQGDTTPYVTQTKTYQITNYNSFSTYAVSASAGTASLSGDTITFTAPATAGTISLTLTVDGQPTAFTITVQPAGVATPTNTNPADGAINIGEAPTLQSSAFVAHGLADTHLASRWTLYQGGTQVHSSGWRTDALTSYTVPAGVVAVSMSYAWTVEHRGTTLGDSPASTATGFSTAATFNNYIATPEPTPANFGDPFEGGFYAGMIWNQITQSTSSKTLATGTQTFTVPSMTAAPIVYGGQTIEVRSRANPANKFVGTVTGAIGTNLTINVTSVGGSGTFSDWSVMARHRVIVAPKASGERTGIALKNANTALPTACQTLTEGFAATQAMRDADTSAVYPAAHWARGLNIGGRTDWYIPARDELELCWRNLKPTTTANYVTADRPAAASFSYANNGSYGDTANTHGTNNNSSPTGAAYTAGVPAQTAATAFRTGGAEAYEFGSAYYWSSSDYSATDAWFQLWYSSFLATSSATASSLRTAFVPHGAASSKETRCNT